MISIRASIVDVNTDDLCKSNKKDLTMETVSCVTLIKLSKTVNGCHPLPTAFLKWGFNSVSSHEQISASASTGIFPDVFKTVVVAITIKWFYSPP